MRFRSRRSPGARSFALLAFAIALAGLGGGCENEHIGRKCIPGGSDASDGGTGTTAIISSPALECPSRICVLANTSVESTIGLCTALCSSDDDCSSGESSNCKLGFACLWPTTVGPFCCQRMCVCRDLVSEPMGGAKEPAVCMPGSGGGCQNVHS